MQGRSVRVHSYQLRSYTLLSTRITDWRAAKIVEFLSSLLSAIIALLRCVRTSRTFLPETFEWIFVDHYLWPLKSTVEGVASFLRRTKVQSLGTFCKTEEMHKSPNQLDRVLTRAYAETAPATPWSSTLLLKISRTVGTKPSTGTWRGAWGEQTTSLVFTLVNYCTGLLGDDNMCVLHGPAFCVLQRSCRGPA